MSSLRIPSALVLVVAALAGAGTMVVELAAVRLLAPWFGTSQAVWTNVIGVVLFALSLGYLVGARLSRRERPEAALGLVLLVAGAAAAWLPALAPRVATTFLPPGLALDEVAGLLRWGSLATAACLFLPSALLLGTIAPLCVELLERRAHAGAGSAGGRVLCVSTLGSLAGTFATSFLLVPELGLARTFLAAGGLLALLGGVVAWLAHRRMAAALVLASGSAAFAGDLSRPSLPAGGVLLEARESPYQSVRVVEFAANGDGAPRARRELQVNEAFDSFQSVWIAEPGPIGDGAYYDVFALPAWWAGSPRRWRVGVLGLGAGTTFRVLDGALPAGTELDAFGVEIDPAVVELGERWMELTAGPSRRVLAGWDARAALEHSEGGFDELVLDAYSNQMEIPAHLCTREFFALARERLAPGGFLCVNVGAFALHDPVLEAVAASAANGMRTSVLALRVPFSRNVVLVARNGAPLVDPIDAAFVPTDARLADLARRLALPGAARRFDDAGSAPLTDDRCDIERLQLRSIELARSAFGGSP
ncbi:MAG: fused MFS/spermidine synthase [Planctomycetes bacterium]|nr:fused MFS/spermidine synthase [Planctomycetota bacterium]